MSIIGGADGPTSLFVGEPALESFLFSGGFQVLFFIVFTLVAGMIIFILIRSAGQGIRNNRSPVLTVEAQVVTKRNAVWCDHVHTTYYLTFQVDSGDRMELHVPGSEYGYMIEGDRGTLTFQGTRFLSFERT